MVAELVHSDLQAVQCLEAISNRREQAHSLEITPQSSRFLAQPILSNNQAVYSVNLKYHKSNLILRLGSNAANQTSSMFGTPQKTQSIFGSSTAGQSSLFGGGTAATSTGSSLFGKAFAF